MYEILGLLYEMRCFHQKRPPLLSPLVSVFQFFYRLHYLLGSTSHIRVSRHGVGALRTAIDNPVRSGAGEPPFGELRHRHISKVALQQEASNGIQPPTRATAAPQTIIRIPMVEATTAQIRAMAMMTMQTMFR